MARTTSRRATGHGWIIGAFATALTWGLGSIPLPAIGQEVPTFEVWDFGVAPRPSVTDVLLEMAPVQQELKMTDAQKKEQDAILGRQRREMQQKIQQARRANKDRARFLAARDALFTEFAAAIRANLKPEQWERLDQIQLQAQGSFAFSRRDTGPMDAISYAGAPLAERLKLSDEQTKKIRTIADQGDAEITKAASFPITLDSKDGPPSKEAIYKLLDSPEFQAAKNKARQAGRAAGAMVVRRIEDVLTASQREAYHKALGVPFDLSRLRGGFAGQMERMSDINAVNRAFGGGGQRADPAFDTKVARPAYSSGPRHPRILFDEAHSNFHTAGGRYKPFAQLIASDGYQVVPNREKFSRNVLQKGDVLVIANAMGGGDSGEGDASDPAFTDAECDAVRDWVKDGGALLLIADHAPFGGAAECLAKRFGVGLSKGATSDPANSEGDETFLVFSRKNQLLADHPITRGRDDSERLNRVKTFTGTSLKGPAGSVPILRLADTAVESEPGDDEKGVSAAGRAQGLAFAFGKGRVVVLGEAAELSAQIIGPDDRFGMNVPGIDNRQMALNILHWLSGLLEPREPALKKAG